MLLGIHGKLLMLSEQISSSSNHHQTRSPILLQRQARDCSREHHAERSGGLSANQNAEAYESSPARPGRVLVAQTRPEINRTPLFQHHVVGLRRCWPSAWPSSCRLHRCESESHALRCHFNLLLKCLHDVVHLPLSRSVAPSSFSSSCSSKRVRARRLQDSWEELQDRRTAWMIFLIVH
jgi:hypothetical protein